MPVAEIDDRGPSGASDIDVCKLLTAAQASSLGGDTYATAVPTTIAPGQDQCVYEGPAASYARMTVIVYQADSGVRVTLPSANRRQRRLMGLSP